MRSRLRRLATVSFALVLTALAASLPPARAAHPEGWLTDLDAARAEAKKSGRPILAVFSAEWCGPCQFMVKEVYPTPEVKKALEKWVPVYLDDEATPKPHEEFKIESYPTIVLLSSDGKEEDRQLGARPGPQFVKMLEGHSEYLKRFAAVEAALEKNPKDAKLWKEKGDVLQLKDRAEEALKAYEKAVELDPKSDAVADLDFMRMATSQPRSKEDLVELRDKLTAFLEKHSEHRLAARAALYRGWVTADLGEEDEAAKLLEEALAKYPGNDFEAEMKETLGALAKRKAARAQAPDAPEGE